MYRIDYYDKNGNNVLIHGFKKPRDAEKYMKDHPEEDFGDYPFILADSDMKFNNMKLNKEDQYGSKNKME